jgi:hypothetical protein
VDRRRRRVKGRRRRRVKGRRRPYSKRAVSELDAERDRATPPV